MKWEFASLERFDDAQNENKFSETVKTLTSTKAFALPSAVVTTYTSPTLALVVDGSARASIPEMNKAPQRILKSSIQPLEFSGNFLEAKQENGEERMVLGCVLFCCESGKLGNVVEEIKKVKGVKRAFSVHGRWDVVAEVEVPDIKALGEMVMKLHGVSGVKATETLVGF